MECYEMGQARFRPFGWCEVHQDHPATRRSKRQISAAEMSNFSQDQGDQEWVRRTGTLRRADNGEN